jgi:hypothetical protein
MDVTSTALSSALAGVSRGLTGLSENAQSIASGNGSDADLAELSTALVAGMQNQAQVEAAAAMLESADEMLGTLIDITA